MVEHQLICPVVVVMDVVNSSTLDMHLSCQVGVLIIKRHNEVRDMYPWKYYGTNLGNCLKEPFIYEEINPSTPALKTDLGFRRVWNQSEALFDLFAPSYANISNDQVLENVGKEKKISKALWSQACLFYSSL